MKKIFYIAIILICGSTVSADAIENNLLWKNICPAGLENAQYKEIRWFWPQGTKDTQELYNYWAQKRQDFEESLIRCNFLNGDFKKSCYENIKSRHLVDLENYDDLVRYKNLNKQIWNDNRRMSKPFMINVFSL